MRNSENLREVWFITPSDVVEIRMADNYFDTVVSAAKTLKATYFVTHYGDWSVFSMQKLFPGNGNPIILMQATHQFSNKLQAIKRFASEHKDAALMWARMQGDS